jgi:hypothetical protein
MPIKMAAAGFRTAFHEGIDIEIDDPLESVQSDDGSDPVSVVDLLWRSGRVHL